MPATARCPVRLRERRRPRLASRRLTGRCADGLPLPRSVPDISWPPLGPFEVKKDTFLGSGGMLEGDGRLSGPRRGMPLAARRRVTLRTRCPAQLAQYTANRITCRVPRYHQRNESALPGTQASGDLGFLPGGAVSVPRPQATSLPLRLTAQHRSAYRS